MTKKVIALAGSPRKRGNTGLLLEAAVKGAREAGGEVDVVYTNSLKIRPCQGCNSCAKLAGCIYQDDMTGLIEAFKAADAFIVSSPVYFGSVSAQLKLVIDRCQSLWMQRQKTLQQQGGSLVGKKPGLFLATSGHPNHKGTRFNSSLEVVKIFGYAVDMRLVGTVFAADTDRIPVTEDSPLLLEAYQAGRKLVEAIK
ncbi:MAG TPA: flavodoxin family protein [Clostridia bacterium]|nr:flavodoxin family protein [Clostridia bacterium]